MFAERTVQYLTFNDVVGCGSEAVTFLTSGGNSGWPSRRSSSAMFLRVRGSAVSFLLLRVCNNQVLRLMEYKV